MRGRRVFMDDHRAAYDMTAYLARMGHRDIGFVVGSPRYAASRARREGFEAARTVKPGKPTFRLVLGEAR